LDTIQEKQEKITFE